MLEGFEVALNTRFIPNTEKSWFFSPSSALTLQKLRQPLRSWVSALPGAEVLESSLNLKERV
jgi:hypothetical protein